MVHLLVSLSLVCLLVFTTTTTADDSVAMLKLATTISPTPWGWSTDHTTDYCSWNGVLCDISANVMAINLTNRNLYGTLPTELSTLLQLKSLDLQKNHLSGPIPSFPNLSSLEELYLGDNNFSSIPQGFFEGLVNLQVLSISQNTNLAPWSIPNDLAESIFLRIFEASEANIMGTIPDIFASLLSLESLKLSYNNLTGTLPASLANSGITNLWLSNQLMGLSGTIDVLSSMTELSQAWLHRNQFTGSIPDLSSCRFLFDLQLRDNQLRGIVPTSLISLPGLQNISLSNNKLQGPVPVFPSNVVAFNDNNNYCKRNPGVPCDPQVIIMLEIASAVGYPEKFSESWQGNDACKNWESIICDDLKNIITIDFGKQHFSGTISSAFANLTSLRNLYLNENNFSGFIPDILTKLTQLRVLDVSNNNLSGKIPVFASSVKFITTPGNPFLDRFNGSESEEPATAKKRGKLIAGVCIAVITFFALILFVLFKYYFKIRLGNSARVNDEENKNGNSCHFLGKNAEFSIEVIRQVTDNFNENNILGKGGFGVVYKGDLPDRTTVAVKRVKATATAGMNGMSEFQAEISVLTKVRHRHLVSLLGYCLHDNEGFLVYEYMPQGTLAQHLFEWRERGHSPLTWKLRIRIALDVARGVEYMHNLAEQSLSFIHRDLKPSNILLGNDMKAKVSDFGLAKNAPVGINSFETRVAGTFGYLAPEYAETGRVTRKVDVYAFGAILMEMITGRKAIDDTVETEDVGWMNKHLVTRFHRVLTNKDIPNAVDQTLNPDEETLNNICKIAKLAGRCTARNPYRRPDIGHVVNVLVPLVEKWNPVDNHMLYKGSSSCKSLAAELRDSFIDTSFGKEKQKHVTF